MGWRSDGQRLGCVTASRRVRAKGRERNSGLGLLDCSVSSGTPPFLSMGFEDESHPPLPLIRLVSYLLDIPKPGATNPLPPFETKT